MAAAAEVSWLSARRPGPRIERLGGVRKSFFGRSAWQLTERDAIAAIENSEWSFFVEVDGERHWLEVARSRDGDKRLGLTGQVDADRVLGALPDRPH